MRKNNYPIYIILSLGLLILFIIPARLQAVFRHQFLRPLIPFGYMIPIKTKQKPSFSPIKKIQIETPEEPSYPGATMAKIIYRNPSTWNDFFWINLGKKSNRDETKIVINSPVIFGGALIGMVDYVGDKQSRVILITNSNLTLSVRALRGKDQYSDLIKQVHLLLNSRPVQERPQLSLELTKFKESLEYESQNWHLAKGELFGTSLPLWRSKNQVLLGRGFNQDFEDEYGGARDLLTGKSLDRLGIEIPILKEDDLLITTGLDGVFPEGLAVGRVQEVEPLLEGAYSYSLKATPIVTQLNDLHFVEVILPVEFKPHPVELRAFIH